MSTETQNTKDSRSGKGLDAASLLCRTNFWVTGWQRASDRHSWEGCDDGWGNYQPTHKECTSDERLTEAQQRQQISI